MTGLVEPAPPIALRGGQQTLRSLSLVALLVLTGRGFSDDWPQWRGPRRDGISEERDWFAAWPEQGSPKVAWRAAVGKGHSTVPVSGGRAFAMGWDGRRDTVFCLDAATGRELWKQSYLCRGIQQWPGPRSTPTVAGEAVFTLGQHGQLRAWDARTGAPLWQRDLPEDYTPDADYGFTWSPLVATKAEFPGVSGDLLILNAGSRGLAVRASDGSIAWGDDKTKGACVSPVPFTHGGRRGVVIVNLSADRSAANLVAVDPGSGRELWRFGAWRERWGAMGVDPIVRDGHVFVTSAEQFRQAARFRIDAAAGTLREDWATSRIAGYTGGAVLWQDHIYLVDSGGILQCLDWNTGREVWAKRGFGERGTLIAAAASLIIQTGSSGEVVVAAAEPAKYRELRRARVFERDGATFTAPVLANGRLYCRSYAGEVVCLDLGSGKE